MTVDPDFLAILSNALQVVGTFIGILATAAERKQQEGLERREIDLAEERLAKVRREVEDIQKKLARLRGDGYGPAGSGRRES